MHPADLTMRGKAPPWAAKALTSRRNPHRSHGRPHGTCSRRSTTSDRSAQRPPPCAATTHRCRPMRPAALHGRGTGHCVVSRSRRGDGRQARQRAVSIRAPGSLVVEMSKDEPVLFGQQRVELVRVSVGHDVGIETTAPVSALVLAAASRVRLAMASRGSTGGGLVPRTAPANAG